MEIGVVGLSATLLALLVAVGWLVADLHPDDRARVRPWLIVGGSAIVVFAVLVAIRAWQVGV